MVRVQNIIFGLVIVIFLFSLIGCSTEQTKSLSDTTVNVNKQEVNNLPAQEQKQDLIEDKGIITDKLKFSDDKTSGEITKNKLTKTAEVKMTMRLNDSEEYGDFMGEQVATAPFMINMACGLFAVAFFNQSALAELQDSGNMTIESEEDNTLNALEGYTVTKSSLEFIDYEDKTKIADCTATGGSWDYIKFNAYRKYESSFFGMQIGELPEDNEGDENNEN